MTGCVITDLEEVAVEGLASSKEADCVSAVEDDMLKGLLDGAVVGCNIENEASLELVTKAESEMVPTIPTLGLVVCGAGALLGDAAAPDDERGTDVVAGPAGIEYVGDAETATLEWVDWAESAATEFPTPAPRVATRPPIVERADSVFVKTGLYCPRSLESVTEAANGVEDSTGVIFGEIEA